MIRNLRKKKGFTQSQLAELILCDRSYISKIETDPSQLNLSFDIIYYIAKALDTIIRGIYSMSTKWKEILTKDQFEILDSYDNPRIDDIINLMNKLNLDIKTLASFYKDKLENSKVKK